MSETLNTIVGLVLISVAGELLWHLVIKRRYPRFADAVEARKGKRPILFTLALMAWGGASVMALVMPLIVSESERARSVSDIAQVSGLLLAFAVAAVLLTRRWWRTTSGPA